MAAYQAAIQCNPNQVEPITSSLHTQNYTFKAGHRVMVQVQSTWFPLIDRNPQTFTDIPKARSEDFRKATERVYRSSARQSSITLAVEPQPWQ